MTTGKTIALTRQTFSFGHREVSRQVPLARGGTKLEEVGGGPNAQCARGVDCVSALTIRGLCSGPVGILTAVLGASLSVQCSFQSES